MPHGDTIVTISKDGETVIDDNGYPEGVVRIEVYKQPNTFEKLPEPLRVRSGHGGSHTFIAHGFVRAIIEDRIPEPNIWEAIAYTVKL